MKLGKVILGLLFAALPCWAFTHPDGSTIRQANISSAAGLGITQQRIEGSKRRLFLVTMQGTQGANPVILASIPGLTPNYIIFDSDFGNDPGDVGALSQLNAHADLGECMIIGMANCNTDLSGPGAMDAINTYYGRPDIPVGLNTGTTLNPGPYPNLWNVAIASLWPNSFGTNGSTAESATTLYRRLLQSKPDKSVTIIAGGQMANLAALRASTADANSPYSGAVLMERKLRNNSISAGQNTTGYEYNFYTDPTNASNFVNNISVTLPVQWNGFEIGNSISTALALTNNVAVSHPERFAYDVFNAAETATARPSWDQVGVLVGVRGKARSGVTYFTESAAGFQTVTPTGTNTFTAGTKNQKYLIASLDSNSVATVINGLMNATPVLPGTRSITQADVCTNLTTAFWKFTNATGGPWNSSVGSFTFTNVVGAGTVTNVTGTIGANSAARFNGFSTYITTPDSPFLRMQSNVFSITALVRFNATNANQIIIQKYQASGIADYQIVHEAANNKISFYCGYTGSWNAQTTVPTITPSNTWLLIETCYVPKYSGLNGRIGVRVNNAAWTWANTSGELPDSTSRLVVGGSGDFLGQTFNGDIDYISIRKQTPGFTDSSYIYNSGTFRELY